jgi:hypothetical protein
MPYPKANFCELADQLADFAALQHERGAKNIDRILLHAQRSLKRFIAHLQSLPAGPRIARRTPNTLAAIRKLRPAGPRRLWKSLDPKKYRLRLEGAFLARCAANALGAIVELWSPADMQRFAELIGDTFPPTNYWSRASSPTASATAHPSRMNTPAEK